MTEVRYELNGNEAMIRDMYAVVPNKCEEVTRKKEESLSKFVKSQGGKVLSVHSEPISKRRYKRNVAKLKKKEERYNK